MSLISMMEYKITLRKHLIEWIVVSDDVVSDTGRGFNGITGDEFGNLVIGVI